MMCRLISGDLVNKESLHSSSTADACRNTYSTPPTFSNVYIKIVHGRMSGMATRLTHSDLIVD